ncbi:MAG: amidohydrolase [Bacteroidales bacterium]|nr:amidohydrolase [Bacteroidales bacterium]MCF8333582.1 amidohydrolase [Bacteroidales bacterium]
MENLKKHIQNLASAFHREVVQIRRHIHQYPELAFEEYKTSEYISQKLTEYGIKHQTGVAKTGIVGFIEGKNPNSYVVGLRADIDALPIQEGNTHDFVSKNKGKMHACGHDAHTASLLGTAKILNELKDNFEGTVKLIFQPSEEQFPGGAKMMIEEGVLKNPKVNVILGQHVYPQLEVGEVGMKSGYYMASTDEIYLTVKGRGGHGALPEQNVDPVLIASHVVVALQQVVSRIAAPSMPTVLSFGRFIAEGQTNIIPDEAKLDGILRTFDETWREEAQKRITRIAKGVAESMGGYCDVFIDNGYPVLDNDEEVTEKSRQYAKQMLDTEKVHELDYRMTAEDFAYYSHKIPACFYRLGVRNEHKDITAGLHSPRFDLDEESLKTAIELMSWLTIQHLKNH